ncbi:MULTISPECIES: hypothetical protein [unclassified Paenibacillus]|uniref:hypothetical protein n=1 Tax=unclassified Paenibacillus TaxID=185978 RepID=UPI00210E393B|nr:MULTISPECIES: hypothetical protein [unclassified Paenibacillus]
MTTQPIQIDLFSMLDPYPVPAAIAVPAAPVLNGFYYERSSDMFVSFAQGRRHYEIPARGCGHLKAWQERLKREREI